MDWRQKLEGWCRGIRLTKTNWWLAENINLDHLGWLVAYCLNNRIITLPELKREISAHPTTNCSGQHAKHQLTAQFCFRLFYCCYEANSFVSDIPHIDFFWQSVTYNFFAPIFLLIISSKRFGYVVVTVLITITHVFLIVSLYSLFIK